MSLVRPLDKYVFVEWMKIFCSTAIGLPILLGSIWLARRGSHLPVVPAIMPITNARQVVRMAQLAGQPMPAAVTDRLDRHGDDADAVRAEGLAIATESSQRLLDEGAPGIHFITMNRSSATLEVFGNL